MNNRLILIVIVFVMVLLSVSSMEASAHEGPPFPIIVDKNIGPCVLSVWADPDVGIGTFFIILDPLPGKTVPEGLAIEVGAQPTSGRLPEARYQAVRDDIGRQIQFKAQVPFDQQEHWRMLFLVKSSQGGGEATAEVEATPPGYGRWDLLLYLFPFLALGLVWLKAFLRTRKRRKA